MLKDIQLLVPFDNENRWTDMLAMLIRNDPAAAAIALDLGDITGRDVTIQREVLAARSTDRVDLLIYLDRTLHTVLEAKALSGLGGAQLHRYSTSYPDARRYRVVSPARLVIHPGSAHQWTPSTWEELLTPFTVSSRPWVADTAAAWLEHLEVGLPQLSAELRWNDLHEGENFALAMRARMSWVYSQLRPPEQVTTDLVPSGGSKAWVTRLYAPAQLPDYVVAAEAEERTARGWPPTANNRTNPLKGPQVWVGLRQHNVTTSAGFDWDYLRSLWELMKAARSDWTTTRAGLVAPHDRANWQRIGSPASLGFGYGEREAAKQGACMFGARYRLSPDIQLGDLVTELQATADLVYAMHANPLTTGSKRFSSFDEIR